MATDSVEDILNHIAANPHDHAAKMVMADMVEDAGKPQTAAALRYMGANRHVPAMRPGRGPNFDSGTMTFVWDSPWGGVDTNLRSSHIIPRDVFDYMPAHGENYRVPHNEFDHGWEDNPGGSAAYAGDMGVNSGRFHRAEYANSREALNAYLLGHAKMVQNQAEDAGDEKAYTDILLKDG